MKTSGWIQVKFWVGLIGVVILGGVNVSRSWAGEPSRRFDEFQIGLGSGIDDTDHFTGTLRTRYGEQAADLAVNTSGRVRTLIELLLLPQFKIFEVGTDPEVGGTQVRFGAQGRPLEVGGFFDVDTNDKTTSKKFLLSTLAVSASADLRIYFSISRSAHTLKIRADIGPAYGTTMTGNYKKMLKAIGDKLDQDYNDVIVPLLESVGRYGGELKIADKIDKLLPVKSQFYETYGVQAELAAEYTFELGQKDQLALDARWKILMNEGSKVVKDVIQRSAGLAYTHDLGGSRFIIRVEAREHIIHSINQYGEDPYIDTNGNLYSDGLPVAERNYGLDAGIIFAFESDL